MNPTLKARFFTPVFWSALHSQLRYCGNSTHGWDDLVVHGSLGESKFAAYYCRGNTVVAMASMGMDPAMVKSAELMRTGKMPSKTDLRNGVDILSLGPPE
jgi:hypothetical protein